MLVRKVRLGLVVGKVTTECRSPLRGPNPWFLNLSSQSVVNCTVGLKKFALVSLEAIEAVQDTVTDCFS